MPESYPPETHGSTRPAGAHYPVAVVGGGQAGLSISYWLRERGIEHVVLEAGPGRPRVARAALGHLLPGHPQLAVRAARLPLPGPGPGRVHGPATRSCAYLEDYVAFFDPPLVEGVERHRAAARRGRAFELATTEADLTADQVVVADRPVPPPVRPADGRAAARRRRRSCTRRRYRNPDRLPEGGVLVVGTGQSGCQIAEDLHLAGRQVHLAVGGAPRVARFYRGRDCVAWLDDMGHYAKGIDEFADADAVRMRANHYVTGRDGGRDIDLRAFARDGMRLYGRLTGIDGTGAGVRRRPEGQPRPRRRGGRGHQGRHRRAHRRPRDHGTGRAPVRTRLGAGGAAARP